MAIDTTLIQGAYNANIPAQVVPEAAFGKAATKTAKKAIEYGVEKRRRKAAQFDSAYQNALKNADNPNDAYFLTAQLGDMRKEYLRANQTDQVRILADVDRINQEYIGYSNFRNVLSDGLSSNMINKEALKEIAGDDFIALFGSDDVDPSELTMKDGEIGFMINGQFKSYKDIGKVMSKSVVDQEAYTNIQDLQVQANLGEIDQNAITKVVTKIIDDSSKSGNIYSLLYYQVGDGDETVLDEMINGLQYIENSPYASFDTDDQKGQFSEDEKLKIREAILTDPAFFEDVKKELITYFTTSTNNILSKAIPATNNQEIDVNDTDQTFDSTANQ